FFWYWLVCRADGLVRYGYRRHVAMIERGASDAVPLVRVYSKRQVRVLLRKFTGVTVKAYHLSAARVMNRWPWALLRPLEPRLGWFLVAEGTKALDVRAA